jgi:branched-subunit amino acid transport protein
MTGGYWLALAIAALGTLALRLAFLGRSRPPKLPAWARKAMAHVPAAVLGALALPEFFNLPNPSLAPALAFAAYLLAAMLTRRDYLSIVAGLAAYWIAA